MLPSSMAKVIGDFGTGSVKFTFFDRDGRLQTEDLSSLVIPWLQ